MKTLTQLKASATTQARQEIIDGLAQCPQSSQDKFLMIWKHLGSTAAEIAYNATAENLLSMGRQIQFTLEKQQAVERAARIEETK